MVLEYTPRSRRCAPDDSSARRLIAAVVRQAWDDIKLGGAVGKDALSWLHAGDPKGPWSFAWCCDQLGLNPNAVRQHGQVQEYHK